jgi:hypothetical protein
MQLKHLLATALSASSSLTFAAPSASPEAFGLLQKRCTVAANAQSCSWTDYINQRAYNVIVGEAYDSSTCSDIKASLVAFFADLSNWACTETACGW